MDPITVTIEALLTAAHLCGQPVSRWFSKKFSAAAYLRVKNLTCEHQAHILQNTFLLGEEHKKFRLAFELYNATPKQSRNFHKKNLIEGREDLLNACGEVLWDGCKNVAETLSEYFQAKHKRLKPPRICIKLLTENDAGQFVLRAYYRHASTHHNGYAHEINKNSAAYKICVDKDPFYSCPNIPRAIKNNGAYVNERLDADKAIGYAPSAFKRMLYKLGKTNDPEWRACWQNPDGSAPLAEACFKSTLVVPIALRNQVTPEFRKVLRNKVHDNSLQVDFFGGNLSDMNADFDPVFGLLCLDHVSANYFDEQNDAYFSFILADWLSLSLWFRIMYIDASTLRQNVDKALE